MDSALALAVSPLSERGAIGPEWLALAATPLAPATAAYLTTHGSMLRALLSAGVMYGRVHDEASAVARLDTALLAAVTRIDAAVGAGVSVSGGASQGSADALLASALHEQLALFFAPAGAARSAFPNYARWASAAWSAPAFAAAARASGTAVGGCTREGGQVDLRAAPALVSALADAGIARNVRAKAAAAATSPAPAATPVPVVAAAPVVAAPALPPAATEQPASNRELPNKSVDERIELALSALATHGGCVLQPSNVHRHAAAGNVEELKAALGAIGGARVKNLFLKAKKERPGVPGDSRIWLVVALADAKTDLNAIGKRLGYAKDGLRFADDETLLVNTGVVKGHLSPLCLVNDAARVVNVLLDEGLAAFASIENPLLLHPFTNEASVGITHDTLVRYITATGHTIETMPF